MVEAQAILIGGPSPRISGAFPHAVYRSRSPSPSASNACAPSIFCPDGRSRALGHMAEPTIRCLQEERIALARSPTGEQVVESIAVQVAHTDARSMFALPVGGGTPWRSH